jgi:hypothetical protein
MQIPHQDSATAVKCPLDRDIAFALAVVRSKPAELTISRTEHACIIHFHSSDV